MTEEWRVVDLDNGQFLTVVGFRTRKDAERHIEKLGSLDGRYGAARTRLKGR